MRGGRLYGNMRLHVGSNTKKKRLLHKEKIQVQQPLYG